MARKLTWICNTVTPSGVTATLACLDGVKVDLKENKGVIWYSLFLSNEAFLAGNQALYSGCANEIDFNDFDPSGAIGDSFIALVRQATGL
jgi:hypothetical protein